jgi:hypothetical protein
MSSATSTDPGLRPWQLFVLAGMLAATAVVLVSTGRSMSGIIVLSLTVIAASFVAVASYQVVGALLVGPPPSEEIVVEGQARQALEREKALVLRSIKELEFDHAMSKISTADFEEMRDRLRVRAVGLIQQLDAAGYRSTIERDLAARIGPAAATAAATAAVTAAEAAPSAASLCARCRTANDADARFCKQCGAPLAEGR